MTEIVLFVEDLVSKRKREFLAFFRLVSIFVFISILSNIFPSLSEIVYNSIRDTYVAVSVWVASTLAVFYTLEKSFKADFGEYIKRNKKWQVFISACLGALPGCGGAIIVTTQYTRGYISFGALVATLTSTMGDAAFLLIAAAPKEGFIIILLGILVGSISGYIVDLFPLPKFISQAKPKQEIPQKKNELLHALFWKNIDFLWILLLVPGVFLGAANALNVDPNEWFRFLYNGFADDVALLGGAFSLAIFFSNPSENNPIDISRRGSISGIRRIVAETAFISTWVCLGFLMYDVTIHLTGWNLKTLFQTIAPIVPLIGILIGWVPGCGPQIVVASLYINQIIPFSALAGNAISNDGDALFPTLALSPIAGILATLYSTVPALIVAYGIYFLGIDQIIR